MGLASAFGFGKNTGRGRSVIRRRRLLRGVWGRSKEVLLDTSFSKSRARHPCHQQFLQHTVFLQIPFYYTRKSDQPLSNPLHTFPIQRLPSHPQPCYRNACPFHRPVNAEVFSPLCFELDRPAAPPSNVLFIVSSLSPLEAPRWGPDASLTPLGLLFRERLGTDRFMRMDEREGGRGGGTRKEEGRGG